MTVALEPPLTSGYPNSFDTGNQPILTAPRYLRTQGMSRWHRPRSGHTVAADNHRVVYSLWCGPSILNAALALTADAVPGGEKACGTCEGRAIGAGQDTWDTGPDLIFSPRRLTPPKVCPGSQREDLCEEISRVARCLACGELVPGRCYGGSAWHGALGWGAVKHEPGPNLVPGCPFHAWRHLVHRDGIVACSCRTQSELTKEP